MAEDNAWHPPMADPRPAWRDNPDDIRSMASRAADWTQFDNPLLHGLIMGGAGYLGGRLMRPLFKRLYPEFSGKHLPWVTALLTAAPTTALSYANMPKSAAMYSAPINPLLLHSALRPMAQQGMISPMAGAAMSALTQSAAGPGGQATVRSYAGTAERAMRAVGDYFDPRTRAGWALAGAGAALASRAFGVKDRLDSRFGMPVGMAVQRGGLGLQLLAAGLNLAGG
jgi:hypothetical protein